jgi:hypothetical protein
LTKKIQVSGKIIIKALFSKCYTLWQHFSDDYLLLQQLIILNSVLQLEAMFLTICLRIKTKMAEFPFQVLIPVQIKGQHSLLTAILNKARGFKF